MAAGRCAEVRKNEKYMDDVFSCLFSNIYKTAKRKNNHVWSQTKFDSLNSIWGDDDEPKADKMREADNFGKNNTKISWAIKPSGGFDDTKAIERHESDSEEEVEESGLKMEWTTTRKSCEDKKEKHQTARSLLFDSDVKSNLQSLGSLNLPRYSTSHKVPSSKNLPVSVNSRENKSRLDGAAAYNQYHRNVSSEESRVNLSKENSSGITKVKETVETTKKSQRRLQSEAQGVARLLQHRNNSAKDSNLDKGDMSHGIKHNDDATNNVPKNSRVIYKHISESQISRESSQKERVTLGSKRTRHDSETSLSSRSPLQKKLPVEAGNKKESSFAAGKSILDTMLSVKIMKDVQWYEYTVNLSDFDRIKKKFPKMSDVLPGIDDGEKEIGYSFDAVKAVFGFLFSPPYNFDNMPEGRTAVEVLAASMSWNIEQFHSIFKRQFLKTITENNFSTIYPFASHFGLQEICDACKTFIPGNKSLNERSVRPRKCSILVCTYIEPSEYSIPLETAHQELDDSFDRDIRNTVVLEAVSNDFDITGFRLLLDTEGSNGNLESATLDIFYSVNIGNRISETENISRPVRSNIVIYLKKKMTVKMGQKMEISVETTVKPNLCYATRESFITQESGAEFSLTLDSNYRVTYSGGKRFLIGKLLYNPIDPTGR